MWPLARPGLREGSGMASRELFVFNSPERYSIVVWKFDWLGLYGFGKVVKF